MRFRLPFLERRLRLAADDGAPDEARAALAAAETALGIARAAYLDLEAAGHPGKLSLLQSALDQALRHYHAARQAVRLLESREAGIPLWLALTDRRPRGAELSNE
jgi:hypothetical protein